MCVSWLLFKTQRVLLFPYSHRLQERVYLTQPPRFQDRAYPNYVCHLHKAFYTLKQAPVSEIQLLYPAYRFSTISIWCFPVFLPIRSGHYSSPYLYWLYCEWGEVINVNKEKSNVHHIVYITLQGVWFGNQYQLMDRKMIKLSCSP